MTDPEIDLFKTADMVIARNIADGIFGPLTRVPYAMRPALAFAASRSAHIATASFLLDMFGLPTGKDETLALAAKVAETLALPTIERQKAQIDHIMRGLSAKNQEMAGRRR